MKLGMNHPMGPLTLADFIGLDVCLAILNVLHEGLGDPKYRPCPLLEKIRRCRLARTENRAKVFTITIRKFSPQEQETQRKNVLQ